MANLGYTTSGGSNALCGGNVIGSLFTLSVTGSVHVTSVTARIYDSFGLTILAGKAAIYSSASALLGESSSFRWTVPNFSDAWFTFPFDAPVKLTSADYIIVVNTLNTWRIRFDAGSAGQGNSVSYTFNADSSFPPAPTFATDTNKYSIYATYGDVLSPPPESQKYITVGDGQSRNERAS